MMQNGSTVEVGLVGNDGILGVPIFLADSISIYEANVQIPSSAVRIRADVLKSEFNRGGALQSVLLRYSQALLNQVSQGAACNRLHTLEERLARWLLTVRDRLESDELPLTQEFMSQMLGTRRSGVTVAAITLQQAGTIRYARGKITILNREGLEATSCECYGAVKGEFKRLLGTRYV
jgi:CRP-like cAMP-binding protein